MKALLRWNVFMSVHNKRGILSAVPEKRQKLFVQNRVIPATYSLKNITLIKIYSTETPIINGDEGMKMNEYLN